MNTWARKGKREKKEEKRNDDGNDDDGLSLPQHTALHYT